MEGDTEMGDAQATTGTTTTTTTTQRATTPSQSAVTHAGGVEVQPPPGEAEVEMQPPPGEAEAHPPAGEAEGEAQPTDNANVRSAIVFGGVARINVAKLEQHISNEVVMYGRGGFPRQSERYYKLMSVLHITRLLYHDGHCRPLHREFYRRLAQIHHQQQQQQQQPQPQQQVQQQVQQVSFAH